MAFLFSVGSRKLLTCSFALFKNTLRSSPSYAVARDFVAYADRSNRQAARIFCSGADWLIDPWRVRLADCRGAWVRTRSRVRSFDALVQFRRRLFAHLSHSIPATGICRRDGRA